MTEVMENKSAPLLDYWFLSADTHIIEPSNLYQTRLSERFREDAPRLMVVDEVERWSHERTPLFMSTAGFAPGDRFLDLDERPPRESFAEGIDDSAWDAQLWLDRNEADGVYGGIVLPSSTLSHYSVKDPELLEDILRVYNEWILEFASHSPDRIKPIGLLNLDDVPRAVRQATEFKEQGYAGVLIPTRPHEDHTYDSPEFEPLWEALEDLELPVNLHVVAQRTPGNVSHLFLRIADQVTLHDYYVRATLADLILSGVFERHPRLRVLSVEHEGAWVLHFLQRIDWHYKNNRNLVTRPRFPNGALPSDYFRQNVIISFTEDRALVQNRDVIGVENIIWGNDYPHPESLYPKSIESLKTQLDGVPEAEQHMMLVTNTAELYGFEVPPPKAQLAEEEADSA